MRKAITVIRRHGDFIFFATAPAFVAAMGFSAALISAGTETSHTGAATGTMELGYFGLISLAFISAIYGLKILLGKRLPEQTPGRSATAAKPASHVVRISDDTARRLDAFRRRHDTSFNQVITRLLDQAEGDGELE